jgi:nucleotide-binding universal stress UspA family protein
MAGRIVVGVDDSEQSAAALRFAQDEARIRVAAVVALHAWSFVPPPALSEPGMIAMPADLVGDLDAERAAAERAVVDIVTRVLGDGAEAIECRAVEGDAGEVLAEASSGADLVVVGSRGRRGLRASLLGSVSSHVVQHAHCPVVIVRAEAG